MQSTLDPMLALDPAMLADSHRTGQEFDDDDDDDEYEYEYSATDTETFFINVDLSSYHGPIRPPRRRQDPTVSSNVAAQIASPSTGSPNPTATPITPADRNNIAEPTADESDRVQILGLHTSNPIVSYQNHIFSCSWADLIGTELFFTHPEDFSEEESSQLTYLRRGKDYGLIAANSVKLLGRRANLISSTQPSTSANTDAAAPAAAAAAAAPAPAPPTGPQSNQARFLDRLRVVKQAKGETDTVRTVFNLRRMQNLEDRLRGWAKTEEQLAELDRLNRAVLEGDAEALATLEELYTQYALDQGGAARQTPMQTQTQTSGEASRSMS